MQGYTKDQPGTNNFYVNVIDDLQQIAENVGIKPIIIVLVNLLNQSKKIKFHKL